MSRGKSKSKPTTSRRNEKQKVKETYAKAREDAQLHGVIPTTPEGAVRDERTSSIDPLKGLPEAVRQSLKENWATPNSAKPAIVAALLKPFFNEVEMIDADGQLVSIPPSPKLLNELAKTILALDQKQWERDNPLLSGQAKGGGATVSIQANVLAVSVLREMFENEHGRGQTALPPPLEPSTLGNGRFDGEVEVGAASTGDQRCSGEGMANSEFTDSDYRPIPTWEKPTE